MSAAIDAADAGRLVERALDAAPALIDTASRIRLVAAGKASPPMARAFARRCGRRIVEGLVVGTHCDGPLPAPLEWHPSSHPVPDDRSVAAGARAAAVARACAHDELLCVLLSGGASALLAAPAPGITLAVKQSVTARLLRADADIHALNCVRKHLSSLKGGQLAAMCAAPVVAWAVSDVVGDDLSVIASGPTVADSSTFDEALAVLDRCGGRAAYPREAVERLEAGAAGLVAETPKPHDARLARAVTAVIGSARTAVTAAAEAARRAGYDVLVLDEPVTGEARVAAGEWWRRVAPVAAAARRPTCVLSFGETTVRVVGSGRGGRNQEFVLALVPRLATIGPAVLVASVGTDGVDGPTDAAGACADASSAARAGARGLDPLKYLEANDAWAFFDRLGDLLRTGPTATNVGDLQVALAAP